jgi:hypothetical protein
MLNSVGLDGEETCCLASLASSERGYHEERIRFSRWFCGQFTEEEKGLNLGNMYSAEATSMEELGDVTGAKRCFEELARRLPTYVWGWIHWSDMCWLDIPKRVGGVKNYERAESILLRCLEQEGLDEGDRKLHGPSGLGRFTTKRLVQPLARLDADALLRISNVSFAS